MKCNLLCRVWHFLRKIFCWLFGCCCGGGSGGSGSGCCSANKKYVSSPRHVYEKDCVKMLRKPKGDAIIGKGYHRSGWFYVVSGLARLDSEKGILLDDFVEQNFCYAQNPNIYTEDWVGIFHHPPFPPDFSNEKEKMSVYLNTPAFKESAKHLKLAITLTEYHRNELENYLDCPVVCIPHPIENNIDGNFEQWNYTRYQQHRKIIQLGFYLRNTQLIYQTPYIEGVKRLRLWSNREWVKKYDAEVVRYWRANGNRLLYGGVQDMTFQSASSYDRLLSQSVIIMELFDASANNGVLDCIIRNTPIIINRHPAVVEYLGADYPLYFDDPKEIPALMKKVYSAHVYLRDMDKSHLGIKFFTRQLMSFVNEL